MLMQYTFFKTLIFVLLFLSTISFIFYNLQISITTDANLNTNVFLLYSYEDLDQQLCKKTINWDKKSLLDSSTVLNCPENENFVSIATVGRTGNLMWAYASVLAVAQQSGLKAYVPSCLKANLEIFFDNLTIPTFKDIIHCPLKIDSFVKSIDDWKINPQKSILLPHYLTLPREILPWIPNIEQEFTMKKVLRDSAQQILKNVVKNLPTHNYTFVGVHVRRTDYKPYVKGHYHIDLASPQFFFNAMAFFKQKYPHVLFIVVSDDPQWCIKQFAKVDNVFVVTDLSNKKNGPAVDMAVIVACNHTIHDYGTFGEWGAILAGGEVVCYDMIQNSKNGSMQYKENWHLMS